jgi:hypothetical protein
VICHRSTRQAPDLCRPSDLASVSLKAAVGVKLNALTIHQVLSEALEL